MVLTIKNFESQNVGPGVVETAPTNLVGVAGTLKATLTWTSATGESGVTWTEEKLVRKEGSAPSGSMDGTTVTTITTKDTYATNGYEDTGLDSTKTYYYKVFAVYDNGTERGSTAVNVTPDSGFEFTPGSDTIAYYPFKEDLLDHSGNLSSFGGENYNFTNNMLNTENKILNGPLTIPNMGTEPRTIMMWCSSGAKYSFVMPSNQVIDELGLRGVKFQVYKTNSYLSNPNVPSFGHMAFVRNGKNVKLYINGNLVDEQQWGEADWYSYYSVSKAELYYNGSYSDLIIEKKEWTAQEILDYYNGTKDKYSNLI